MHSLLARAREKQPVVLSVFFNSHQILRIEDGVVVYEAPSVKAAPGLLTIHFDDNPTPEYVATVGVNDD